MNPFWWLFLHITGIDNLSGPWYAFWSGFGSDLGEISIIAAAIGVYRHHNCNVKGCWRIGRRTVDGTSHVVCHKHHPEGAPTHEDVLEAHRRAKESRKPRSRKP